MSKLRLRLPGRQTSTGLTSLGFCGHLDAAQAEVRATCVVDRTMRGGGEDFVLSEAEEHDVLQLRWENGIVELVRVSDVAERFGAAVRDPSEGLVIPSWRPLKHAVRGERGLSLDLVEHIAVKATAKVTEAALPAVIRSIEEQAMPKPGLYRVDAEGHCDEPFRGGADAAAPYLVLLHGTFSRAESAFAKLFASEQWATLVRAYPGRIVALQHHTVTRSPSANALDLVRAFAADQEGEQPPRLHLLSHSRGGLIGELLCRFPLSERERQNRDELLEKCFAGSQYQGIRSELAELEGRLSGGRPPFIVERFLRVAAPAAGTQLAGEKLDRYLSVLLSVIGRLVDGAGTWFGFVKAIATQLVSTRTRADACPGLEAMMPERALVRFLNIAEKRPSELAVVAGDVDGGRWLQAMKEVFADLYFGRQENDFVVDTASMLRGVPRDRAFSFYHRGPEADHFSYFREQGLRDKLVGYLTAGHTAGFQPMETNAAHGAVRGLLGLGGVSSTETKDRGAAPTVFLLPGIMGSRLRVGGDLVWIDVFDLATGGLSKLTYPDAPVSPDGVIERYYAALTQFLNRTFNVEVFPFDWRLPIEASANELANRVNVVLKKKPKGRIYFIAHSMGGLVTRAFIAGHPDTWRSVIRGGGRLVMLGTPNFGSYVPASVLTLQHDLMGSLATLDITQSRAELTRVVRDFPGLLEMLPRSDGLNVLRKQAQLLPLNAVDLLDPAVWAPFSQYCPKTDLLSRAREFRRRLDQTAVEPDHMVYVAGSAPMTLCRVELDPHKPRYYWTRRGDGTVPWDLGLLPGVPTYYVEADHGGLPNHQDSFLGYVDLLVTGTTRRLRSSPAHRGRGDEDDAREERFEPPEAPLAVFPSAEDLVATVMGSPIVRRAAPVTKIGVRVVNGDARHARFPLLVGHYRGDPIESVEAILDETLDGQLSRDHRLGIYPGAVRTASYYRKARSEEGSARQPNHERGALVVGLGTPGRLSRTVLEDTATEGMLRYAVERYGKPSSEISAGLGLSAVLVGTWGTRMSIEDSVSALVAAMRRANERLEAADLPQLVQFTRLDIIELYRDTAIAAAHAARRVGLSLEGVDVADQLETEVTYRRNRPPSSEQGWYQRVEITANHVHSDAELGPPDVLSYTVTTGLARSDSLPRAIQWRHIESLLAAAPRGDTSAVKTLRQYLLHESLLPEAQHVSDLVLQLDEWTAQVPWELFGGDEADSVDPTRLPGVLRTLEVKDPRQPKPTQARRALVIGEPKDVKPALPGARQEAEAVAAALETGGFEVTKAIHLDADATFRALLAADYDIVHIAAHGHFDTHEPQRSGVVLEADRYLTAAEFENLRATPSLVFLNCCHLGKMRLEQPGPWSASVARELIRSGVGAVVVAGWAVSDDAAKSFAATLYGALFRGRPLMQAVREARVTAAKRAVGSDVTWGAYQVYGDPGFVLRSSSPRDGRGGLEGREFVSPIELVEYLADFGYRSTSGGPHVAARLAEELKEITASLERWQWHERGDVNEALGVAFGALGDYAAAVVHLRKAVATSEASFRSLEQLANFEVRAAEGASGSHAEGIERSLDALSRLIAVAPSGERYSLLGSSRRRRAATLTGEEQKQELRNSIEAYQSAANLTKAPYYPLSVALGLRLCLGDRVTEEEIQAVEDNAAVQSGDTYAIIARGDVDLLRHMAGLLPAETDGAARTVEAYRNAFRDSGATQKQRDEVFRHIANLIAVCEAGDVQERLRAVQAKLPR